MMKLCKSAVLGEANSEEVPSPHHEFLAQISDLKSFTSNATQQINREVAFCMKSLAELKTSYRRSQGDGAETVEPPSEPEEKEKIQELQPMPRRTSEKFKLFNPPEVQKTIEAEDVGILPEEQIKKQKPASSSNTFKIYDFNAPREEHDKLNNFKLLEINIPLAAPQGKDVFDVRETNIPPAAPRGEDVSKVREINIPPAAPQGKDVSEVPALPRKSRRLSIMIEQRAPPQVQNHVFKKPQKPAKKISEKVDPRAKTIEKEVNSEASEVLKELNSNSVSHKQDMIQVDADDIPLLHRIESGVKNIKVVTGTCRSLITTPTRLKPKENSYKRSPSPKKTTLQAGEPMRKKKIHRVTFDDHVQYKVISPRPAKWGRSASRDEDWTFKM